MSFQFSFRISNLLSFLKKQFRYISILLIILFFVLVNVVYSTEKTTITLMIQALEAAQWQNLVEKFERENPDIDLEIISAPNATNLVEDLYTSAFLLGDSPYDLVYLDIVWVQKFAAANWLQPLNNFISEDELKQFLKGDVEGGKYQDSLYRIPFRSDGGMLYYRTDLLEKNGYNPPETFTELINISQDLQAKGKAKWGYVWQGRQYEGLSAMFVEVLQGFGGYWINSDTLEVGLDSPEAIASVQFLLDTIKKGISPSGVTTYAEEETRRIFENGQTVFLRNWPYVAGLASKSEIAGKFSLKPMVHQPQHQSGACQGGWGLGMSKNTKHPEEAWRVIEFITSEDSQRDFILETGYVPSRKSLFNDPQIVEKYPYYPQLLTVVENSVLRPPIAQYAQASDILQRYLSAALTQTMTPENAMKKAATETRQLLN
ncbi:ABC transporter substrate-binding protein [Cyanobacterium aponinum]|uniref:Carbohydrate ABC transporter substrate-binding protein, CUT1 family n=1 Tax=Cyanobacterium aponinum (strain PCC 10605) TaxID=755178 RepID=K9Z619_CYAAP|nr:ABC transporter substrate-binding protein [Cyanobacterium aponinum]AFZ54589.1 carbohydrate ABC transporter substrate-binding protein, CUT1 family [Cyanobacterium aponinum PCC 10605]